MSDQILLKQGQNGIVLLAFIPEGSIAILALLNSEESAGIYVYGRRRLICLETQSISMPCELGVTEIEKVSAEGMQKLVVSSVDGKKYNIICKDIREVNI